MSYIDYLNHIVLIMALSHNTYDFLWQYNSRGFEKMCITWNKVVRKMYSLPYHTHRWILGPLTNQRHIKYQLFARDFKLLHSIKCQISNSIVRECLSYALSNSNTVIGYKLIL